MSAHESVAKLDLITSFWASASIPIRLEFICERRRPECEQMSPTWEEYGRKCILIASCSLGNESQYDEPTESAVYMGWMSDWAELEEWELAASTQTPFSSTAIRFHYNTPLKAPVYNHTWSLIRGENVLLFTSGIIQKFQQCLHKPYNATQYVQDWQFDLC